jgi:hypothetical protein
LDWANANPIRHQSGRSSFPEPSRADKSCVHFGIAKKSRIAWRQLWADGRKLATELRRAERGNIVAADAASICESESICPNSNKSGPL